MQDVSIKLSILDISSFSTSQQEEQVKETTAEEAEKPFEISTDHLLRVRLIRLGEEEHIVLVTMHHIISDGWSTGVLIKELGTLYGDFYNKEPLSIEKLPIQYLLKKPGVTRCENLGQT